MQGVSQFLIFVLKKILKCKETSRKFPCLPSENFSDKFMQIGVSRAFDAPCSVWKEQCYLKMQFFKKWVSSNWELLSYEKSN